MVTDKYPELGKQPYSIVLTMPSLDMATAFLLGLCVDNGRLMSDPEFCLVYHLPEGLFHQDYIPGVKDGSILALRGFITAILEKQDGESRHLFVAGKVKKSSCIDHSVGREAYKNWFKVMKLSKKIHSLMEATLTENDAHPRQLLADQPELDTSGTALPDSKCIYSTVEKPLAQAVYGQNALTSVMVPQGMANSISTLLHHLWERLRKERKRFFDNKEILRKEVQSIVESESTSSS
jgi:hypothetical protein